MLRRDMSRERRKLRVELRDLDAQIAAVRAGAKQARSLASLEYDRRALVDEIDHLTHYIKDLDE